MERVPARPHATGIALLKGSPCHQRGSAGKLCEVSRVAFPHATRVARKAAGQVVDRCLRGLMVKAPPSVVFDSWSSQGMPALRVGVFEEIGGDAGSIPAAGIMRAWRRVRIPPVSFCRLARVTGRGGAAQNGGLRGERGMKFENVNDQGSSSLPKPPPTLASQSSPQATCNGSWAHPCRPPRTEPGAI